MATVIMTIVCITSIQDNYLYLEVIDQTDEKIMSFLVKNKNISNKTASDSYHFLGRPYLCGFCHVCHVPASEPGVSFIY